MGDLERRRSKLRRWLKPGLQRWKLGEKGLFCLVWLVQEFWSQQRIMQSTGFITTGGPQIASSQQVSQGAAQATSSQHLSQSAPCATN